MAERLGKYTIVLNSHPSVTGYAAVVGKTEGEGPLKDEFDFVFEDDTLGEASFEKAESALQKEAVTRALSKAGKTPDEVDFSLAGDLLNQCIGSSFGLRSLNMPFIGLYGACSTMALSLGLASMLVDCGAARVTVASTSSHFCSAERQFRLPLEYGGQRTPTSQRTATAAGASVVERRQSGKPAVDAVTIGRITDLGIKDANNMGAAMAPAAANTIADFLKDTSSSPSDFDMILTGDLGKVGSRLLRASAKGSRNRYRERSRGLRIAPVRRRKAGCSRRRLRLRLRCLDFKFVYYAAARKRRAVARSLCRHGRADVAYFLAAGREYTVNSPCRSFI